MTEEGIKKFGEFANLPFYLESDDQCDSLLTPHDPKYEGAIQEAEDDIHFHKLLSNSDYDAIGGIIYSAKDVRAIFWLKRKSD